MSLSLKNVKHTKRIDNVLNENMNEYDRDFEEAFKLYLRNNGQRKKMKYTSNLIDTLFCI